MLQSWLTIPNSLPLWQNKNWSIEKISEKEIAVTNGYNVIYGYFDSHAHCVRYDRIEAPKYILDKAFKLATKHLKPLI